MQQIQRAGILCFVSQACKRNQKVVTFPTQSSWDTRKTYCKMCSRTVGYLNICGILFFIHFFLSLFYLRLCVFVWKCFCSVFLVLFPYYVVLLWRCDVLRHAWSYCCDGVLLCWIDCIAIHGGVIALSLFLLLYFILNNFSRPKAN